MKFRDVIKMIEKDGWTRTRISGSHMIYRHPTKPGQVTVPAGGKMNIDVKPGTLSSIMKQAGLRS